MSDTLIAPIEAPAAVLAEFRSGFHTHAALAAQRQENINAASRQLENSSRLMEGIGQLKYRIDPDLYWHMRQIFGPDCWKDKDFTAYLEREGVIQRVKGISDKLISLAPSGIQKATAANAKLKANKAKALSGVRSSSMPSFPTSHLPILNLGQKPSTLDSRLSTSQ
jgi:hypothetical protein